MDAERKFPNLCGDKSELISRVAPLVLLKLQSFKSEQMVNNMLKKYEKENSQVQTLLALSLLPFLFTPTLLSKKRKLDTSLSSSKPSKSDAYRSFFSNFEVIYSFLEKCIYLKLLFSFQYIDKCGFTNVQDNDEH
jgi:hypothetical protein